MDLIATLQEWAKGYELVTSDIALEADPGSDPRAFKFTIVGYIQPKCNCRDVTSIAEAAMGVKAYIPGSASGCPVHGALAHKTQE